MPKTINADELQKELAKYLEEYQEDITEGVQETTDSLTKKAIKELKQESPRGARESYAKGWRRQTNKKNKNRIFYNFFDILYGSFEKSILITISIDKQKITSSGMNGY